MLGVAQTIGAQINPEYPVLAGHIVFLAVLCAARRSAQAASAVRMGARFAAVGRRQHGLAEIQRWTPLSIAFTGGFGVLIVALVFVPVAMGASVVQDLTTL